jgi:hypothetical protein
MKPAELLDIATIRFLERENPALLAALREKPSGFIDLSDERARIIAALAGIGACLVGAHAVPAVAEVQLPIMCAAFRSTYGAEAVKLALRDVVSQEVERQKGWREN